MKVLSVTVIPPGEDAQWWRINSIANGLRLKNCSVDLVHYIVQGSASNNYINNIDINQIPIESIKVSSPLGLFLYHFKKLYSNKYDLVYGNTYGGAFFCIFSKLQGTPLILDLHGISEEAELNLTTKRKSKIHNFINKFLELVSLQFSDKIICVSKKMIDYLHNEKKIPLNKMIYGPNGVDLGFFKFHEPQSPGYNQYIDTIKDLKIESKFVFGYIGAFQAYQGVEKLIEAAKRITDDRVLFLFVGGDGISREGNIIFVPKVARELVPIYYSLCNVLVLPRPSHISTQVAAPTKFAEYCAMGKPILTTDVGDAAELVKEYQNGIIVENNDADNLEKGILGFLKLEDSVLFNMGKNSRRLAENEFNWDKICSSLITELEGV